VIITGGLLGIIAMRMLIGQLLTFVQRYPPLVDGAFIIIAWVGLKLLIEYLHQIHVLEFEVPRWLSLGLIVLIFTAAYLYARRVGAVEVAEDDVPLPPDAAGVLFAGAEPESEAEPEREVTPASGERR